MRSFGGDFFGNSLLEIFAMNIPSFDAELKVIEEWIAEPKIVADCIKIAKEENKDDKPNYDE